MKAFNCPEQINLIPCIETSHGVDFSELSKLDPSRIPHHIAIIADGNRRWAKSNGTAPSEGHRKGGDTIIDIVKAGKDWGIKVMTLFLFSTENWSRPPEEISALMWLLQCYLIEQQDTMVESNIRFHTIGNIAKLPPVVVETIEETKSITKKCDGIDLVFALNYGGRDDICRAALALADDIATSRIQRESVTEAMFSKYLDTAQWRDPDLLIRTSGELRVSNFLLWQISYSEIYKCDALWPDFKPEHLFKAVLDFQKRERRLGAL